MYDNEPLYDPSVENHQGFVESWSDAVNLTLNYLVASHFIQQENLTEDEYKKRLAEKAIKDTLPVKIKNRSNRTKGEIKFVRVNSNTNDDTELLNKRIPYLLNSVEFGENPASTLAYNVDQFLDLTVSGKEIGLGNTKVKDLNTGEFKQRATIREYLKAALHDYREISKEYLLNEYKVKFKVEKQK